MSLSMSEDAKIAELLTQADLIIQEKIFPTYDSSKLWQEVGLVIDPTTRKHRERVAALQHEVAEAKTKAKSSTADIQKIQVKVENCKEEIRRVTQRLELSEAEVSDLKKKIKSINERLVGVDGEGRQLHIEQAKKDALSAEYEVKLLRKIFKVVWDKLSPDYIRGYSIDDVNNHVEMFEFSQTDRSKYSIATALWDLCTKC